MFHMLYGSSTVANWYPSAINAHQAIKIKEITLVVCNNSGGALGGFASIAFDEDIITALVIGNSYSVLAFRIELPAANDSISIKLPIEESGIIVGDRVQVGSSSANILVSALITYDVIKTKFSEYGQAEKTLTRALHD